jgi:hypothetical protein
MLFLMLTMPAIRLWRMRLWCISEAAIVFGQPALTIRGELDPHFSAVLEEFLRGLVFG